MVLGLDARAAAEVPAGRGRYVRELLAALARRDDEHTYVLHARTPWDGPLDARFRWSLAAAPDPAWHLVAAERASRRCAAFLSTNSYLTPWFLRVPTAVVVYDLVAWLPWAAPQRHALPPGFVLAAGTLEPRKNLPRLIAAHARLPQALRTAHPLAVVGPRGWEMDATLRAADARPGDVRLLGHVAEDDLAALYATCTAFAYPSLYEGFGLPLAEAMAAGAACLTSDVSSLPEVGGDAVLYADPHDVDAIAAGLRRLLAEPALRQALGDAARARAASLSWDATAARTLSALEGIAA
jgi:glycosyltransferase involved in cell wall biosynthesis